jgi:Big-like domain-containing protein/uncharacterized protein DUF4214
MLESLELRLALTGAPPVAANETYMLPSDAPFHVSGPGVLANDSDPEGDPLTAQLFTSSSHGVLSLSPDGSFDYVPDAGFQGSDTFVYRVYDGSGWSGLAAATLRVGIGDAPPAVDLDGDDSTSPGLDFAAQFVEGAQGTAIADSDASITSDFANLVSLQAVITNRLDGADETLSADTSGTQIQATFDAVSGALTLSGVDSAAHYLQVLKTIEYANASQSPHTQTRNIDVTVADGAAQSPTALARISLVAINDPPSAADDSFTASSGQPLNVPAPGLLSNDSDADGDPLSAVLVQGPQHGSLQLAADGSFVYTPSPGYSGADQFTYRADDGVLQSPAATVAIQVSAASSDPPAAANDVYQAVSGIALSVPAAGVLANDSATGAEPVTAELVSNALHGTLSFHADGSFEYTPQAGFSGLDGFSYQVHQGTQTSDVAGVTIQVAAAAQSAPPTAVNDVYQAIRGIALSVPAAGVLVNDIGAGTDPLTAELVSNTLHGTLTFHADGSFEYTPEAGFSGFDGFSYQVHQGTETSDVAGVTIQVASPTSSAAPGAVNDVYVLGSTNSLTSSTDSVLSNDSNGGGTLTAVIVALPQHGTLTLHADGTFSYTADGTFHGIDQFSYKASSSGGDSTAEVEIVSQPAALILKLYRDVLNRAPTLAEWQQGTDLLTSGQKTLEQIDATLMQSDEYLNLTIEQFYQDLLHRHAEQSGLDYWRNQIWRASDGPDDVEIGILSSPEFWQQAGANGADWVAEIYRRFLDRQPDQAGSNYWAGHLADGSLDRHGVAQGFVTSLENDHSLAAAWYTQYLDRPITAQELASLTAQLLTGDSHREELAQEEIVATAEYQSVPPQPSAGSAVRWNEAI